MTLIAILFLIVIGGVLLVLEFLFLPGLIAGIVGLLMQIAGIWASYHFFGSGKGTWVLTGVVLFDLALLIYAFRGGMWRMITLETELKGRANTLDNSPVHVGDKGITISRLAPMGRAMINGHSIEVHSLQGFINEQVQVEVIKVEIGKIWVKSV